MTARPLPSVVCLTIFRSPQPNRIETFSGREDLSTNSDKNVGQRPNQMLLSTHLILRIVQSTPLVRSKMTQQTRQAPAMIQTT